MIEEISIQSALTIRRSLRLTPLLCFFAIGASGNLAPRIDTKGIVELLAFERPAELDLIEMLGTLGLLLSAIRVAVRRPVKVLGVAELLTVLLMLLLFMPLAAGALYESYTAAAWPMFGIVAVTSGVSGWYQFLYPRRRDPRAELTVREIAFALILRENPIAAATAISFTPNTRRLL
jgi:hypothetical protein